MKHYFKSNLFPFLTLLAIALLVSLVYWGITYNSAAFKLAEKFNAVQEIKDRYTLEGVSLKRAVKDDPRDRIEVQIGNKDNADFSPDLKIARWDDEVNVTLTPKLLDGVAKKDKNLKFEGDKIKFSTPKVDYVLYEMPISEANPEGAYEYEVDLKEKPATNKTEFALNTKGLDFFYQPALNKEVKIGEDGIVSCTETKCLDKDGKAVLERPENVVGSYAVYASENKINYVGGKEYKCGQVGMIYRPRIEDANGDWVWGELHIENGILSVTIPQEFLDKAVYPVRHAAGLTFGYTTAGSSSITNSVDGLRASAFAASQYTASTGDTVTKFTASVKYSVSGATIGAVLYTFPSTVPVTLVGTEGRITTTSAKAWRDSQNLNVSLSNGTNYTIGYGHVLDNPITLYYTSVTNSTSTHNLYTGFPATWSELIKNAYKYSVYATYTAGPSAPTVTNSSGASNITETAARLNGEVTATGGENPTVHIYWGDNDGGTTAGNWDHDENLGTKGAATFYQDISSLAPGTSYYYRAYATNSGGNDWADSTATFDTTAIVCGDGTCNGAETHATCPADCPGVINIQRNVNFGRNVNLKAGGVAAPAWACGDTLTYCGDNYTTVQMTSTYGSGCWLGENLRNTTKPDCTTGITSYCHSSGCGSPWGRLYDWTTMMNGATTATGCGAKIQGICPTGWHIPSDYTGCTSDDFSGLGSDGGALKKTGTSEWNSPNTGATNASNWTGYPAGYWSSGFGSRGGNGYFWSSSEYDSSNAWLRGLYYNAASFNRNLVDGKSLGFSVRCVKD